MDLDDVLTLGSKPYTHNGKEFTIKDFTILDRAKYVRRLKNRAHAEISNAELTDAMREALTRCLLQEISAGIYEYGSQVFLQSLMQPTLFAYALWLCAGGSDDIITEDECIELTSQRNFDLISLMAEVTEATADPKVSSDPDAPSNPGPRSSPGSQTKKGLRSKKRRK